MDKKLYKESLDSIRISDEAVEKAIKRLRGADTVAKVNVMKKTAKKFTAVGALAASIAVILILGTVFFPSVQNQNGAQRAGFSIIANAAVKETLSKNEFKTIAVFGQNGGTSSYPELTADFSADLNVEGKDIDTITYTINNGVFGLDTTKDWFVEMNEPEDFFNEWGVYISNDNDWDFPEGEPYRQHHTEYAGYKSFTVKYDNQPIKPERVDICSSVLVLSGIRLDEDEEAAKALKIVDNWGDNSPVNIEYKSEDYPMTEEYIKAQKLLYSRFFDATTITVTANYKDGHQEKETLQLHVSSDPDSYPLPVVVEAKII